MLDRGKVMNVASNRNGVAMVKSDKRTSWRRGVLGGLLMAAAVVAAAPSCSVIVDTNTKQCDDSTPCPAGFTCNVAQNVCVAESGILCAKTSECAGDFQFCAKDPGKPTGKCVALKSPLCQTIEGDYQADNVFLIGSIHPTTAPAPDDVVGIAMENSIKLAINDIRGGNGLPPAAGQTSQRTVVMIGCSDEGFEDKSVTAAKHLVEDLKVQAIIGGAFSGLAIKTATEVTIPNKVLFITASGTSTLITDLADKPAGTNAGLVWRTVPSDSFQAQAIAKYVSELEGEVRGELSLGMMDQIKVAVLYKGDAYGKGLRDVLQKDLFFNGKPALDNGTNYITLDYGNPDDPTSDPTKYGEAKDAAVNAGAHIILLFGTGEAIKDVYAPIELGWTELAYRPRYVFTDANYTGALADAINAESNATKRADWRRRTTGVVPGPQDEDQTYKEFRFSYNGQFTDPTTKDGDPSIFGAASAYDAAYLLFYSAATIKDGVLSGPKLAEGMTKMSSGENVNAGTGPLSKTVNALLDGTYTSINYNGAFGPLDFDNATGEPAANVQIFCLVDDGTGKATNQLSGRYYDASKKALDGVFADVCK